MLSQRQSRRVRALHRRKERRSAGECLVEGPRVIDELLGAGSSLTLVLYTGEASSDPAGKRLESRVRSAGVEMECVSDRELRRLAGTVTPQGWLAVARIPQWTWSDLDPTRLLVLDGVSDPGNVGTLMRTAEALGVGGLVGLTGTADPWNPKVVRASAGSSFRVPWVEAPWDEVRDHLRRSGTPLWVAAADGEPLLRGDPPPPKVALVLGNEAGGVSRTVRSEAERIVAIPMRGQVESLNAALAGAILLDRLFGG
jgi:TrmH family RNA methyltransferase